MRRIAALLLLALVAGCGTPSVRPSLEERYPDAACRQEASAGVAKLACAGCYGPSTGRERAFDELYRKCLARKP